MIIARTFVESVGLETMNALIESSPLGMFIARLMWRFNQAVDLKQQESSLRHLLLSRVATVQPFQLRVLA